LFSLKKEANTQLPQWTAAPVAGALHFNGSAIAPNDQAGAAANQGTKREAAAKQEFKITRVTPRMLARHHWPSAIQYLWAAIDQRDHPEREHSRTKGRGV
jgi:hypothetical protein